jgi:hypothetical protein
MVTLYDARDGFREMITALDATAVAPNTPVLIQNMRQSQGGLMVRGGVVKRQDPPASGTVIDVWSGSLGGLEHILMALSVSGSVRIYEAPSPTSAWVEVTSASGLYGATRMADTGYVSFEKVRIPAEIDSSGNGLSGIEVLLISNGRDYIRVYDPEQSSGLVVTVHQPIVVPSNVATIFKAEATFNNFTALADASAFHFHNPGGLVNQTRFKFHTNGTAPISNCLSLQWQPAATGGDIASFSQASPLFLNSGLVLFTEDQDQLCFTCGVANIFSDCKIDVATSDNATYGSVSWITVYDSSNADPLLQRLIRVDIPGPGIQIDPSTGRYSAKSEGPRIMWYIPTDNISGGVNCYGLRITLGNSISSSTLLKNEDGNPVNKQLPFLTMAAAGTIPGLTEFSLSYEDLSGKAESPSFVASNNDSVLISAVGGPLSLDSSQAVFRIPVSSSVPYDYVFTIPNTSGASTITGAKNGIPDTFNLYKRGPSESVASLAYQWPLYTIVGSAWNKVYSGTTFQFQSFNPRIHTRGILGERVPPSDFQITIPPSRALKSADNRLFAGAPVGFPSDVYFSKYGYPFRMQAITEDPLSGGRTSTDGEAVQAIVATNAEAQGRSLVYVLTTERLCSVGGSGPLSGSATDSAQLSTIHTVLYRGTRAPRSVQVSPDGALFYLDHTGQYLRYHAGAPVAISRFKVDDRPSLVPNGRLSALLGVFFRDHYYSFYTLGGTDNLKALGWHDVAGRWEFEDTLPIGVERAIPFFKSTNSGDGNLFLLFGKDGTLYEHLVSGSNDLGSPVNIALAFGALRAKQDPFSGLIDSVTIDADPQSNSLDFTRTYRAPSSVYKTTVSLSNGWVSDDNLIHTAVSAPSDGGGERGRVATLLVSGSMDTGTRIYGLTVDARGYSSDETK